MNKSNGSDLFRALRMMPEEEFLRIELDMSVRGEFDRSLLHEAIAFKKLNVAVALVERGAPLDVRDSKGQTPLQYAIVFSFWDLARMLLEKGANPNVCDKFGNNALWTACLRPEKDYDFIEKLVERGADPNNKNGSGRSAVDFAKQSNNAQLLKMIQPNAIH